MFPSAVFFRGLAVAVVSLAVPCLADAAPTGGIDPAALYQRHCAVCHGDHGDGNTRARNGLSPPPRDFTAPDAAGELSRERMITSVTHGRPGTAMMSFHSRLSDTEIGALVDYIRATFMVAAAQPVADAGIPARGKAIYRQHCAVCHGDKGSGAMWTQTSLNPPPRDFTAAETRAVLTRERMMTSVTYGRPGTAMMSFRKRLSTAEIADVVDYIRATFITAAAAPVEEGGAMPPHGHPPVAGLTPAPAPPPKPADMSLPFPNGLKGNYAQGREFYLSNCFTCHGTQGNGEGPRAKFIEPRPRNFLGDDARTRLNRPALFTAIQMGLTGTVMPAWGKVLDDQQIADVAEYVFREYIHPAADKKKLSSP